MLIPDAEIPERNIPNDEEISVKGRLQSGNVCYRSEQNLLSSSSNSKNVKIKVYRNIIVPVLFFMVSKLGHSH